jgi:hypothetical protein
MNALNCVESVFEMEEFRITGVIRVIEAGVSRPEANRASCGYYEQFHSKTFVILFHK